MPELPLIDLKGKNIKSKIVSGKNLSQTHLQADKFIWVAMCMSYLADPM